MGLTKDFLKFQQSGSFNLLASPNGMVQFVDSVTCAVAAAESVSFYNMRTLAKTKQIRFEGRIVTSFALTKDKSKIAVGYDNGSIHLHKIEDESPPIVFNGHKTGVNCLTFSDDGFILASGGKDSVIALWDVLNESGICSLFGHKGTITHLRFVQNGLYLVSSSKDTQIRFWSLLNKCCFYLLAESQSEIYSFAFLNKENLLVVANSEIELSVFELKWNKEIKEENDDEEILDDLNKVIQCKKRGSLLRQAKGRALQLSVSSDEAILCCVGADSLVDIYRNFTEEESTKRFRRKLRKLRQRLEIQENEENKDDLSAQMLKLENEVRKDITTIIARIGDYRADSKVKWVDMCDSFTFLPNGRTREYRFYCLLKSNNVLGVSIRVDWKNSATESFLLTSLGQRVHRTDIRALAISSKSDIIVTGSNESAIVWDLQELVSLNKFVADGLQQISAALLFANDTQLILGTRTGSLFLFNLKACELIERSDSVHDSITGLCAFPNKDGFVSFGQDKKARFWCFERAKDSSDRDYLSIRSKRVLELQDEPLCAAISPNGKFIAFGLLDNTSRVFFMDSLKYFVSLYGHSLPIYCIDISHDSKLIITGSGDKSVRIWGLDFGDCHRSLFAHDGNVTCVQFCINMADDEKLFWSAGSDGKLKQWDAVTFNHIQTLNAHTDQIDAVAQNFDSKILISASRDKSIRVWELTDELIVLQEEEERKREEDYEKKMIEEEDIVPGETKNSESGLATLKSMETIKSHIPHILLRAYPNGSFHLFIGDTLEKIQRRIHHNQIVHSIELLPIIDELKTVVPTIIEFSANQIGFNIAALKFLQMSLEDKQKDKLFKQAFNSTESFVFAFPTSPKLSTTRQAQVFFCSSNKFCLSGLIRQPTSSDGMITRPSLKSWKRSPTSGRYAPNCRAKIRARKWTCCGRYIGGEMRTAIAKHHHPKARSPSGVDKYLDGEEGENFLINLKNEIY
uniref:WD_REPEATS_REGION domain-containing protein n=1 Tax=Meloidogyne floridensis TaxID=298350 RepID=A0A915P098_9BILA